jgi:hypothetical protein
VSCQILLRELSNLFHDNRASAVRWIGICHIVNVTYLVMHGLIFLLKLLVALKPGYVRCVFLSGACSACVCKSELHSIAAASSSAVSLPPASYHTDALTLHKVL